MKKTLALATTATGLMAAALLVAADPTTNPNLVEAKGIAKELATRLQGELKAAIKEGGPVQAIGVCKDRAPAIAADLSAETGWTVGRRSLKVRNPELDTPDDWEHQVLTDFERRKAAGEDAGTLAHAETVEADSGRAFRFMKAIPTQQACLTCHGTEIDQEVTAALDRHYPDDQGRGFKLGDIRGAVSLSKPL